MLCISVNKELEYCVVYWLEGVRATEVLCKDKTIALQEIDNKLRLEMGLAKGKKFTTTTGREI